MVEAFCWANAVAGATRQAAIRQSRNGFQEAHGNANGSFGSKREHIHCLKCRRCILYLENKVKAGVRFIAAIPELFSCRTVPIDVGWN